MSELRVLTVRQPWAWAIVHGGKDVENRTRNIAGGYRGPVAIHAGQTVASKTSYRDALRLLGDRAADYAALPFAPLGVVIGVVDLVGVHHANTCFENPSGPCSPWPATSPRADPSPGSPRTLAPRRRARGCHLGAGRVMPDVDFAHTPKAEASRRRKARALADAAIALGLSDEDLLPGAGHRAEVVKAAGVNAPHPGPDGHDDTWFVVHQLMTQEEAR